ncbi:MAG TPA: SDR family NAD(P)-dependent oxidoreductase, partial [Stenomitos sp.]
MFPGQGSQWLGMGRQLFAESEVFRSALERCAAAMAPHLAVPLLDQLFASEDQAAWEGIDTIQPLIFAVQVALAEVWRSWGVEPQAVVGHSMGEVAAAHVAGALCLEDAARIICLRSHLMKRAAGQGAMALVDLSWDEAKRAIAGYEGRLALAACNGPSSTVLSGDRAAILELLSMLEQREVFCRLVNVDVASHSPHMDPLLDELEVLLGGITPARPTVPMVSTVTGQMVDGPTLDATYWARNMREPVLFSPAIQTLGNTKHDLFVEISPHPILTGSVRDALAAPAALVLPSLKRGEAELATMLGSLAALFTVGQAFDWERVSPGGRFMALPTYRWQRERYWFEPSAPRRPGGTKGGHPLLGEPLSLAGHPEERVWQAQVDRHLSFVQDHQVFGATIFPGTAYLEMARAAASRYFGASELTLSDLELHKALILSEAETYSFQISLSPVPEGSVRIRLHSRPAEGPPDTAWTSHASVLASPRAACPSEPPRPEALLARFEAEGPAMAGAEFYRRLRGDGSAYAYGPTFQGIQRLWRGDSEALAEVAPPDALVPDLAGYHCHPALLDVCGQAMMAAVSPEVLLAGSFLPVGIRTVRLMAPPSSKMWCHARCTHQDDRTLEGDVLLYDEHGVIAEFEGLKWQAMEGGRSARVEASLYQVRWQAEPLSIDPAMPPSACLLFADAEGTAESVATLLEAKGITCYLAFPGQGYERSSERRFRLRPDAREDMVRLLESIGAAEGPACRTIVHLGEGSPLAGPLLTPASVAEAQTSRSHSVLALIQAIGEISWPQAPRLYLVTAGVQPVADVAASALMEAPLWGLGKTIAQEHPELRCTCLDLDLEPRDLAGLATELLADDAETLVAIRSGVRYVERLQPLSESEARPDEVLAIRPDATYLITGGLGALGLLVSRWLADHGARHLLLLGRTAPRGEAEQVLSELRQAGVSVTVVQADVADPDQLRMALAATGDGAPLRGVVHAAGLLDDGMLLALDAERFQRVMAPKIGGAWNLHALTRELPLDFFVLFSSASSLLGSSGQGAYAAANAYLDALAHHRRSGGLPGL